MRSAPIPFELTEARVREQSSSESFRRGEDYYRQGTVLSLTLRGGVLRSEVAGSQFAPYEVRVAFDEAGITGAACSCPYGWGGWCKHIVAALLACIHEPESVKERRALEEVLSGLDRDELQAILLRLAEHDPSLIDVIESELSLAPSPARPAVEAGAIRSQVRSIIHSLDYVRASEAYWHTGGVVDEVRRVLGGAWSFIEAGDGRNALLVLEAITDEYMQAWELLDDSDGEVGGFFEEVGAAWTEALLSAELTQREQENWGAKLDEWWGELEDYGVGETFEAALRAAEEGWDHPPLLRILEGEAQEEGDIVGRDDPLVIARLNVLERQGRYQEYLRLAEAGSRTTSYAAMLVRLGKVKEAVEYGLEHLYTPDEALAAARALRERGELEEALRIGEHGLSLDGRKGSLAVWVRDLASEMGETELALEAALAAFRADPDLVSYRQVRELSGEGWPKHRAELLDHLRQSASYYSPGHVEVFLHEELIQDAIDTVEKSPTYSLLRQVTDAAIESHPDWVIETCRKQAEEIMDSGKSSLYGKAVDWLAKARDAYLADEREGEWQAYLDDLIDLHKRKYKLRPMLEDLGKQ